MEKNTSARTSAGSWPRYNWILIALQLLSAAVVLVCLGWYGLNDRSGLPSGFMCWLPGVAAGFTLLYAVLGLSASNLKVYEVFIGDAISLAFWIAVICKMSLLIAETGTFGTCIAFAEGSGRNSCAASQIVLALAVDLSVLSLAKIIIAFLVRRRGGGRGPSASPDPDDDCEKLYNASE
ncbi:hypothetical protein L873DRAFT_1826344 [Choiromyces venosus 120613-1]|uniref:Uncharacterized protein n=1 Tax=Choiromyces venosus 120613-1 TaxID=1336337 RepID=A0A3N4JY99_9PEZI|nr:hypothetical protein L873DRAFT_1826344 [Choiromyces venosus 120613-1]